MKNIFSLLLLTAIFVGINSADAKTNNNISKKEGTLKNEKITTETNTKISSADKANIVADDTTVADPNVPWYKPKNKRYINIEDVFVGIGGGYTQSYNNPNSPYYNGVTINAHYGSALFNKYLHLEFNNNADFMYSPNNDWFSKVFSLPKSKIRGVEMGFYDEFTMGLNVVIIGSRKISLTAGPLAGCRLSIMPSMELNSKLYYISAPISISYGLKTNLFIGQHIQCFAQYSNSTSDHVVGQTSQPDATNSRVQRQVPVDFGLLRIGAAYIIKPWW